MNAVCSTAFQPGLFARRQRREQTMMAERYLQGRASGRCATLSRRYVAKRSVPGHGQSHATKPIGQPSGRRGAPEAGGARVPLLDHRCAQQNRREGQLLSTAVLGLKGVADHGDREYLRVWLGTRKAARVKPGLLRSAPARLHGVRYAGRRGRELATSVPQRWRASRTGSKRLCPKSSASTSSRKLKRDDACAPPPR